MRKLDTKGQITIFLSLMFLVVMIMLFCILDGIRIYLNQGLALDAFSGAGREVTANYDKALYTRYHLFFLDPREQKFMIEDGMNYMESYCEQNIGLQCENIQIHNKNTILDQDYQVLRGQIKKLMKYQKIAEGKQKISDLVEWYQQSDSQAQEELQQAEQLEGAEELEKAPEPTQEDIIAGQEASENAEQENGEEEILSDDVLSEEQEKDAFRWNEIKKLLKSIFYSGILLYVTDDRAVSNLEADLSLTPSASRSREEKEINLDLSFGSIKEVADLLRNKNMTEQTVPAVKDIIEQEAILGYIHKNFRTWLDTEWDKDTVLKYEVEYLIGGKNKDQANLKYVADKIFLLRFIANYAYIQKDAALATRAGEIAMAVTGLLGVPQVKEAVRQLLLAALSCGETLLDVHTLMAGKSVPVFKDKMTWTLSFENAVALLKQKKIVKEGSKNFDYRDYLKIFLVIQSKNHKNCLRMLDLMQCNVRLDEPEFLISDCLSEFEWEAEMKSINQYPNPLNKNQTFTLMRKVSYE